jgi:hypothetical protein
MSFCWLWSPQTPVGAGTSPGPRRPESQKGSVGPMSTQRMNGIEATVLRAAADALIGVHPEAAVSLTLTEDGLMHVEVEHPVERHDDAAEITQIMIGSGGKVIPEIAPAANTTEMRERA